MTQPASDLATEVDEPVLLSALQHWLFCPRQCALIHLERQWEENALTAEGRVAHEVVHATKAERRHGIKTIAGMPLSCERLRLAGVADLVELLEEDGHTVPFPVEHKRGRPKAHRADEVQLCAQALCLEEMFAVSVPAGALFYGEHRRRLEVVFDAGLRTLTESVANEVRGMFASGRTPAAVYESARCDRCSLIEICRPKALQQPRAVLPWLVRAIEER